MLRTCRIGVSFIAMVCAGCAGHKFNDQTQKPTVADLAGRIRCELLELVHDGSAPELEIGNYGFAAQLSLTVNEAGSLAPTFLGTFPVTGGNLLLLGGFSVSKGREDNMFVYVSHSTDRLRNTLKQRPDTLDRCRALKSTLGGELGIRDKVLAALTVPDRAVDNDPSKGEFGGVVTFTLARRLEAVGPRWVLEQFTGPGGFASLGATHTNKITFAFAQGTGKRGNDPEGTARAREVLRDALFEDTRR